MRTLIPNKDIYEIIEELRADSIFQILKYNYNDDYSLNQVKIILDNSKIKITEGSLSYFKGDIEVATNSAIKTISKKIFGNISNKVIDKTILVGSGEIYLIPTSNQYTLIELEDEEIIINSDMFIACEEEVTISETKELTNETILFNNLESKEINNNKREKLKLSGSGLVALKLPVTKDEIKRMKIFRDVLSFKEDKVILRSGIIEFDLEDSETKEGYLNIYSGSGELWICDSLKSNHKNQTI